MDTLFKDLTYAVRGLRKNIGFATVATITIALGIGACTAIFSVVNAVLLRPLPYANAQRLTVIWGELRARNVHDWPFSPPDLRDLQQQSTGVFDDVAGMIPPGRVPLASPGADPEQIRVGGATPNLFRLLGARILAGRDFVADDGTPVPQLPNQAAGAQAAGGGDSQPRVLGAAVRRRSERDRQRCRARQRSRAHRRRARAGLRAVAAAARAQRDAHPTCGRRRGSTSIRPTATTWCSGSSAGSRPGSASSRRSCRPIASPPTCASTSRSNRPPASTSTWFRCSTTWSATSGRRSWR